MEKELQSQLAAVIPSLIEQLKTGKDFVLEQAPDVIQQLLAWNFVTSVIGVVVTMFVWLVCAIITRKLVLKMREDSGYWEVPRFWSVAFIISSVCTVVSVMTLPSQFTWLKIWIAPKVWLIEYASHLVK